MYSLIQSSDIIRWDCDLTVSIYDQGNISAAGEERFLGCVTVKPQFKHKQSMDNWFRLSDHEDSDSASVSGEIRLQITYTDLQSSVRQPITFKIACCITLLTKDP